MMRALRAGAPAFLIAMAACGDGGTDGGADAAPGGCPEGQTCLDPGESHCATTGEQCLAPPAARQAYAVTLDAGHIHIHRDVAVTFRVADLATCTDPEDVATCTGVPGLTVTAFSRAKGEADTTEQALAAGVLDDNGDGTYTWTRNFKYSGVNMVGISFEDAGETYAYSFPLETSRGGGEDYFCDSNGDLANDLVAQIRWSTTQPSISADGAEITFQVEIVRSINTPLNEAMPFRNTMDALRPAELVGNAPTVVLMADTGTSATPVGPLTPTYRGRGIYEVKRAFAAGDLVVGADSRTFWLAVSYVDDRACTASSADREDDYHFVVTR